MTSSEVFNTPFELGLRMVFLLNSLHPHRADLQTLMYLDYAVIYTGDLGGPPSLHTPVPLRGVEYASRRDVIEQGLSLMALRAFVDAAPTQEGIDYGIGESGPSLIELLGNHYATALRDRCNWVAANFRRHSGPELEAVFGARSELWRTHFIDLEDSLREA